MLTDVVLLDRRWECLWEMLSLTTECVDRELLVQPQEVMAAYTYDNGRERVQ